LLLDVVAEPAGGDDAPRQPTRYEWLRVAPAAFAAALLRAR
jgi:hypothetical protein